MKVNDESADSALFDIAELRTKRMSKEYEILDISSSLKSPSFKGIEFICPGPPDQPRNPPRPKKKDYEYPQAQDLEKLHNEYGKDVEAALEQAHVDGIKEWFKGRTNKSPQEHAENDKNDIRNWQEMFKIMRSFGGEDEPTEFSLSESLHYASVTNLDRPEFRLEEIYGKIISNPSKESVTMSLHLDPPQRFHIPAGSSFILDTFPSASESLSQYTFDHECFDLVLLDPPWHNKAVSRLKAKKHLSYNTMKDIITELPPIESWLAPGGVVGIWCTNNLKMINKVKNTLFKRWKVTLIAEWFWLKVQLALTRLMKVTTQGQPVVNLSSTFRKPYEILLIARRPPIDEKIFVPKRKVIIAVPSYHSQKPCLKGLLSQYIADDSGLRLPASCWLSGLRVVCS